MILRLRSDCPSQHYIAARLTLSLLEKSNRIAGSLKGGRLDLVYYRDPGLSVGDELSLLDSALAGRRQERAGAF